MLRSLSNHHRAIWKQVGTPIYVAPEVVDGNRYGSSADVYSFGLMLLEALAGDSQTVRGSFNEQVRISRLQFVAALGWRPTIPPRLWEHHCEVTALLCECWHQDPHERPAFTEVVERMKSSMV
mgnify:CR=1 FL=1